MNTFRLIPVGKQLGETAFADIVHPENEDGDLFQSEVIHIEPTGRDIGRDYEL